MKLQGDSIISTATCLRDDKVCERRRASFQGLVKDKLYNEFEGSRK
jgi:hypothetical protein